MQLNDWLTATLSVLTISLTILGVLIAVVALWGYRGIKDEAKTIADTAAKERISSYLDSETIQDKLREEIQKRIEREADKLFEDLAFTMGLSQGAPFEKERVQPPFDEEYPNEDDEEPRG